MKTNTSVLSISTELYFELFDLSENEFRSVHEELAFLVMTRRKQLGLNSYSGVVQVPKGEEPAPQAQGSEAPAGKKARSPKVKDRIEADADVLAKRLAEIRGKLAPLLSTKKTTVAKRMTKKRSPYAPSRDIEAEQAPVEQPVEQPVESDDPPKAKRHINKRKRVWTAEKRAKQSEIVKLAHEYRKLKKALEGKQS